MTSNAVARTFHVTKTQELIYELKVQEAMNARVITVEPHQTMEMVCEILKAHRISGTPVTKERELLGIVSLEDLIQSLLAGERSHLMPKAMPVAAATLIQSLLAGERNQPVRRWMNARVMTLYADEPLVHAVKKFEQSGYGRFPVIDRKTKELVGILTKGDILRCLLRRLEIDYEEETGRRYNPKEWFSELVSDRTTVGLRYHIAGSDFAKAGEASSRLKRSLRTLSIPPEAARRITIASYEAEMNMVIFAHEGELHATVEPGKVTVTAADHGPGIPDIERAMQPGYSTAPDWVRELGFGAGMGLPNIKNCSDDLQLESKAGEGTRLQFMVHT